MSIVESPTEKTSTKTLPAPLEMFGVPMHPWTVDQTTSVILDRLDAGVFTQHGCINVAKVVNMQTDAELKEAICSCDIISVDGAGVVWGSKLFGKGVPERVNGTNLFELLLSIAEEKQHSVYFLGARQEVLDQLLAAVRKRYPELVIAGSHHGYFWDREEEMVDEIAQTGASMLFVGISPPLKEKFIGRWRDKLGVGFAMGVGGSFDVLAGATKRAPTWMQNHGLEWFYRLIQEPRRMWKRYLHTNSAWAWMLLKAKLTGKHA